ncbi:GNAT family N-acetyltransferase [Streptomyces sp. NPDC004539]|uniref:GNAT family N-acetyltransferase n=1 Tax=Streptomyces sp. NPDC004539 TaxID=3154280 RepID=UPI00339E41F2
MFFRWDWLRPVLTAPIMPTLGPVHPHALTVDLFEDTLRAAVVDRGFLHSQMRAGQCGPVLAAAVEGRIVGAIGPMEVRPDAIGFPQLRPQYFAVPPEARGHGLGRALWRAAMHRGQSQGAAYQLLQTEVGGPSDRLCRAEGLTSLGFSHSTSA